MEEEGYEDEVVGGIIGFGRFGFFGVWYVLGIYYS